MANRAIPYPYVSVNVGLRKLSPTYLAGRWPRADAVSSAHQGGPRQPNQAMTGRFDYWEGAATVSGDAQGLGYLEMTGY